MTQTASGEFLGHPKGLFILFFTEMWERFSYYGMRALLQLYMINYFLWTQSDASQISKWYTSLVYLTPILGGFLADRYLGNKWAIIIGAVSMAIGHFCMAFERLEIFYAALIFLIIGNGFFKPNMSTQVGRLYAVGDPRRDGAYTIFYMGINLGAFLAPLVCGALAATPGFGFHWGFAAAGVGMVIGLLTYLFGLPLIRELPPDVVYDGPGAETAAPSAGDGHDTRALTEAEAARAPSVVPTLAQMSPMILVLAGIAAPVVLGAMHWFDMIPFDTFIGLGVGGGISALISAWVVSKLGDGLRDRVLAILILGLFVIFFWAAFEQASNAMNVFADKTTNRFVTQDAPTPSVYPPAPDAAAEELSVWQQIGQAFAALVQINPVATATFQSINPLAIFLLAPLFAWLWTSLPRHGIRLSIATKMAIGVFLQGWAFALMIWAVQHENQSSSAGLAALPSGVWVDAQHDGRVVFRDAPDLKADESEFKAFAEAGPTGHGEVVHGGRMRFNGAAGEFDITGVLADTDRDRLLRASVSPEYLESVRNLALESEKAGEAADEKNEKSFSASTVLRETPPGFDLRFAGFAPDELKFDDATRTLTATIAMSDRDYKRLLQAGSHPELRRALNELYISSAKFKVNVWWLFWFYILCTLGELCLSPVGLSMVSKLAPAKYSTMLMGMWLLTSFFGNFVAGFAGESYGSVHPTNYFIVITAVLFGASLVCFLVVKKVTAMMHGVR